MNRDNTYEGIEKRWKLYPKTRTEEKEAQWREKKAAYALHILLDEPGSPSIGTQTQSPTRTLHISAALILPSNQLERKGENTFCIAAIGSAS